MKTITIQAIYRYASWIVAAFTAFSTNVYAQQGEGDTALAQTPLFVTESFPPLNMLVMGRDHKLYYEAYNDASDLDGDGVIDIGYKPDHINYYGYFNNNACYIYDGNRGLFKPEHPASGQNKKMCDGKSWSGDFLNYLTTSRMDALRRVLYGGWRVEDSATTTVLQAAYIPRDAHSAGKSYDPTRDGSVYNISDYAPLAQPAEGTRHLFAVTTLASAPAQERELTQLRVLNDSQFQVWDWVSKESPVAQDTCRNSGTPCAQPASSHFEILPSNAFRNLTITTWKKSESAPRDKQSMDAFFKQFAVSRNLCGSGYISNIDTGGSNNNPFVPGENRCTHDNYLSLISGQLYIPSPGNYRFAVDGDDAVDVTIEGVTVGRYGANSSNRNSSSLRANSAIFTFSSAGWKNFTFRHVENFGGDNWGLAWEVVRPASVIKDYKVRVDACSSENPLLREDTCKAYPNNGETPIYKPTGLLHDFGENEKMYFGLLTGSYQKNISGGVLRRNMSNFMDEVNIQTGQFNNHVDGVVANINRLKTIGLSTGGQPQYSDCGWITNGPLSTQWDPSRCAMWGNPIAEMMFEAMRYFSGATEAHETYNYPHNGSKDAQINLSKPEWIPPYQETSEGGGGYQHCARPVLTVLSDINPSYDFKVPGSRFQDIDAKSSVLSEFNVSSELRTIGEMEGIHGHDFFIGQSNPDNADAAPSVKRVDDMSWVRGLSPQEPSKEGTYYSAGVARFGANHAIFGNEKGKNRLMTYAVALASPLPEIRFPVGGDRYVTIAPFAKSVTGSGINNARFAPTNQIVDYYMERIANTGDADRDESVNEGRPFAQFRINYEDVEQGADHDMDAIARYTVALQADGNVTIDMVSEYASGGIGQHMGYVISGTTQDGMYIEVRDRDTASVFYALNTPSGKPPGYCVNRSHDSACRNLPLQASRTFEPSTTGSSGSFLKDPLWYAAKYGMPGRDPATVVDDPDNYFLVTNATTLKEQLTKAFNDILQNTQSVTSVAVDLPDGPLSGDADVFRTAFDAIGWSGDVVREEIQALESGYVRRKIWSAAEQLAGRTNRNILFSGANSSGETALRPFTWTEISKARHADWLSALNRNSVGVVDGLAENRIQFLRGESNAMRQRPSLNSDQPNVLGDIVNSSPLRVSGADYLAGAADRLEGPRSNYAAFARALAAQPEMVYVGANDGMLHAFRAEDGHELFSFIPEAVRENLTLLTAEDYGLPEGTPHQYFVDGSPVASDVFFNGAWHKVLLGSLGAGGRQIFALDITDPHNPVLLWEFGSDQNSDMGYSLAEPVVARLNDVSASQKGKWVALVPGGYQSASSSTGHASLFVLDIQSGEIIKHFKINGATDIADSAFPNSYLPLGNGLSRINAVDNNRDGTVDMAYAGDLLGNVWRFDLRSGNPQEWVARKFFVAQDGNGRRQPITSAPYVIAHPYGTGDIVIVGTGRFLTPSDKDSTQSQTVYGIWDRYTSANADGTRIPTSNKTRSHLVRQVFTALEGQDGAFSLSDNPVQWYSTPTARAGDDDDVKHWGWYVDFPRAGEKLVYDMKLYGRALMFTAIRTSDDPCSAGLGGALYAVTPETGAGPDYSVFDMNNDGIIDRNDLVQDMFVAGMEVSAGKSTITGEHAYQPTGERVLVDSGVEYGRQSWRELPPNKQ